MPNARYRCSKNPIKQLIYLNILVATGGLEPPNPALRKQK